MLHLNRPLKMSKVRMMVCFVREWYILVRDPNPSPFMTGPKHCSNTYPSHALGDKPLL